ncbi:MAG TPA: hypothetical protein DCQ04_11540 [Actinobacteria bacterium]|nr:hypothetical protein [Actinomycetota bacterium]
MLRSAVGAELLEGAGRLEVVVLLLQAPRPMTAVDAIAVIAMARDFMIPPRVGFTLSGRRAVDEDHDAIVEPKSAWMLKFG